MHEKFIFLPPKCVNSLSLTLQNHGLWVYRNFYNLLPRFFKNSGHNKNFLLICPIHPILHKKFSLLGHTTEKFSICPQEVSLKIPLENILYTKSSNCSGRSIIAFGVNTANSSTVRNPQLTSTQSIPEFSAVAKSTSESPT